VIKIKSLKVQMDVINLTQYVSCIYGSSDLVIVIGKKYLDIFLEKYSPPVGGQNGLHGYRYEIGDFDYGFYIKNQVKKHIE
jgi:hypothetical protein